MSAPIVELLQRGLLAQSGGDDAGAREAYGKALELDAENSDAQNLMGVLLFQMGEYVAGLEHIRRATELRPLVAGYQMNLGNALLESGQVAAARITLQKALALAPGDAGLNYNLGRALLREGQRDAAEARFRKAIDLRPEGYPDALSELASLLADDGRVDEAELYFRHAVTAGGSRGGALIRQAMLLPPVPASEAQIEQSRASVLSRTAALGTKQISLSDPLREVGRTPVLLSSHGEEDREILSAFARACLDACPALSWTAPHCDRPRTTSARPKIGFVSKFMRAHDIGRTAAALMEKIDGERFELYALFVPPFADDAVTARIRGAVAQSIVLPDDLARAREAIAALELDLLLYLDVTVEPFTYFLSCSRLAPVQCVSCLHPDTSGVPNVDYYISSALFEPEGASSHYSERLHLISGTTMPFYYERSPLMPSQVSRATVGLPAESNVYLCPHEPSRIHPAFDSILDAILARDPEGVIVLTQPEVPRHAELLQQRLENSLGEAAKRTRFLPPRSRESFLLLLGAVDVMLDPIHFGSLSASVDAFSVGLPVVTLPTALMRGRQTSGLYHRIGYMDCIAKNADDYVDIAVRLATNRSCRSDTSREIRDRSDVLFDDMAAISEYENFFAARVIR